MRLPHRLFVRRPDARNALYRVCSSVSPVLTLLLYCADQPGNGLPLTATPLTGGAKMPWKPFTTRHDCQRLSATPIWVENQGAHTVSSATSASMEFVACALRHPA